MDSNSEAIYVWVSILATILFCQTVGIFGTLWLAWMLYKKSYQRAEKRLDEIQVELNGVKLDGVVGVDASFSYEPSSSVCAFCDMEIPEGRQRVDLLCEGCAEQIDKPDSEKQKEIIDSYERPC